MALTTHPHLTPTPPLSIHGLFYGELYLYLYLPIFQHITKCRKTRHNKPSVILPTLSSAIITLLFGVPPQYFSDFLQSRQKTKSKSGTLSSATISTRCLHWHYHVLPHTDIMELRQCRSTNRRHKKAHVYYKYVQQLTTNLSYNCNLISKQKIGKPNIYFVSQ